MGRGRAIGLVTLILGAAALAWMFDRKTEQECKSQESLRKRNDWLRENYGATRQEHAHDPAPKRTLAQNLARNRADACQEFLDRLKRPQQEFEAMDDDLQQSLKDTSTSPYRRNALRLMQARLTDARNRVTAFNRYGGWYLQWQQDLLKRGEYDTLIDFPDPDSRLPDDWYYDGKIALAELQELSSCNVFGQHLALREDKLDDGHYSDAFQRSLVLQHPDQTAIPIQIHARNNPHYFQACVLRGALYVEHALAQEPFPAIVSRPRHDRNHGDGYDLQCFPAFFEPERQHGLGQGVLAFLPRSESSFPGKRYLPGERIEVFLHHHDLGLRKHVTVTQQRESLQLGTASTAPIFLCADGRQHDLHPLLEAAAQGVPWQLHECRETDEGLHLQLQLGNWQVHAHARLDDSQLQVTHLEHTGLTSVDVDELPFRLRLIDDRLSDSAFIDLLCFQNFLQFCRQQALFGTEEEERQSAGHFFVRWNAVNEFLLEETGYQTLVLDPQGAPSKETWDCRCQQNLTAAVQKLLEESTRRGPRLYLEERFMGHHGERWLRIGELSGVPERVSPDTFQLHHGGIRRPDAPTGQPEEPRPLRLRLPNAGELANLGRQQRALQAFMGGRLYNPNLQPILLMPHRYEPCPDPAWARRVQQELHWQDPHWQDPLSASHAKRIIEAALVESNLYLIQGPPGTGKTTCIVELLHQVYQAQPDARVLVVSQQNTAVDNALDRFLKRHPEFAPRLLRVGRDATKVDAALQSRVTTQVLMDYLTGRQREYSQSAAKGLDVRAHWVDAWVRRIYTDDSGAPQFDEELSELLVQDFPLVGATCVGLASGRHGLNRLTFDLCIIDEAGRSTVPELLIPLMRSRKAILIGDHFQLPPSVASRLYEADAKDALPFLEETFLKTSFFEQLYNHLPDECRGHLNEQFRMAEPIGDLVAELFYSHDGRRCLQNGRIGGKKRSHRSFLDEDHQIQWFDVSQGRQEKENGKGPSLVNRSEVEAILHYLQAAAQTLELRQEGEVRKKTVAVITPYGGQKRAILQKIKQLIAQGHRLRDFLTIDVNTVDSFQGSEADVVLYSTVRTQGDIRFLLDRQRLNVACSRARENLVFFGASEFLRRHESRTGQPLFTRILERADFRCSDELRCRVLEMKKKPPEFQSTQ